MKVSMLMRGVCAFGAFALATTWSPLSQAANCPLAVSGATNARLTVDGVLLSRYARGLRGTALISGVATPSLPSVVETNIANAAVSLDVDSDGVLGVSDAVILSRAMAGMNSSTWVNGITFGANATRTTPKALADYISGGCVPIATTDASRFLAQASFGTKSITEVNRVKALGYAGWLEEQFAMPKQFSMVAHLGVPNRTDVRAPEAQQAMWIGMMKDDQLRQRVMFALSQLMVASGRDGSTYYFGVGLASYVDVLYDHSFGNFRDLLEGVTRSTGMGAYLSHMYNRKEDPITGARPDQNYAREVMQLFSIGLWELNQDGSRKLDAGGQPIPSYTEADVVGASRVLTGWAPAGATAGHWNNYYCFCQSAADTTKQSQPMQPYDAYHSTMEKKFLGVTIPAGSSNTAANLKILLDRLHNHPNVGPFIGKQLIQRLVTSNPSPGYISRVAAKFNDNGDGVRGDMKATIKAILLDSEARDASFISKPDYGRVREPVLRFAQMMRTFKAQTNPSYSFSYNISTALYDKRKGLWQYPLDSPTVFNHYFPDYTPPNSLVKLNGLVAPELQITTPSSVGDVDVIFWGFFENAGMTDCCSEAQRNYYFLKLDYSEFLPLVGTPPQLVEALSQRFMSGQMSQSLKDNIISHMSTLNGNVAQTSGMPRGVAQIKLGGALRAMVLSPEYIVQK
jgi:uncharacterized protein (DUF1800 family)